MLFVLNSCEQFIDLQPRDRMSVDDYWKKSSDLKNYMLQFYPLFSPNTEMVESSAGNSDNMVQGNPSAVLNGERVARRGNWAGEWSNIRKVNIFFKYYERCEDNFDSYKHYVGEAHFFRAWFYYDMLKTYGDIPWYSEVLDLDSDDQLNRPRDPRTLVADSILADLDKAISFLDARATTGNSRISKEAALAFKTRVALFEGTWQKYHANTAFGTQGADPNKYFRQSVSAGEELMKGNSGVGLYSQGSPDSDYFTLFGLDNMSKVNEVLLYRAFNAADGARNSVQSTITYNTNQKGVTWDLVSTYLDKTGKPYDYTKVAQTTKGNDFLTKIGADCDPRLKSTIWIPGDLMAQVVNLYFTKPTINEGALQLCPTGFQVKKTANPLSNSAGQSWEIPSETGYIIMRYGEVLVNYAEAKYELDKTVAFEQLNQLRTRVGMPAFTVNKQSADPNKIDYGYSITDELYEIRRERRVELALEGHRKDDYRRWAAHALIKGQRPKGYPFKQSEFPTYQPPLDANGLIDYYATIMPAGYRFRENVDYLTSIPQDELALNPKLVQNPGW
jgi:hypothetical protein